MDSPLLCSTHEKKSPASSADHHPCSAEYGPDGGLRGAAFSVSNRSEHVARVDIYGYLQVRNFPFQDQYPWGAKAWRGYGRPRSGTGIFCRNPCLPGGRRQHRFRQHRFRRVNSRRGRRRGRRPLERPSGRFRRTPHTLSRTDAHTFKLTYSDGHGHTVSRPNVHGPRCRHAEAVPFINFCQPGTPRYSPAGHGTPRCRPAVERSGTARHVPGSFRITGRDAAERPARCHRHRRDAARRRGQRADYGPAHWHPQHQRHPRVGTGTSGKRPRQPGQYGLRHRRARGRSGQGMARRRPGGFGWSRRTGVRPDPQVLRPPRLCGKYRAVKLRTSTSCRSRWFRLAGG
jgi:hypothetical protein